jgi:hypothetical protein
MTEDQLEALALSWFELLPMKVPPIERRKNTDATIDLRCSLLADTEAFPC